MAIMGSLLYASQSTRPDIAFAVGALSRYTAAPTTTHMRAALGVLRYLYSTKTLGHHLTKSPGSEPLAYCDADYGGDLDSRRSTTGYVAITGRRGCTVGQPPAEDCGHLYSRGRVRRCQHRRQGDPVAAHAAAELSTAVAPSRSTPTTRPR